MIVVWFIAGFIIGVSTVIVWSVLAAASDGREP